MDAGKHGQVAGIVADDFPVRSECFAPAAVIQAQLLLVPGQDIERPDKRIMLNGPVFVGVCLFLSCEEVPPGPDRSVPGGALQHVCPQSGQILVAFIDPAQDVFRDGESRIDTSPVTGEPVPVMARVGDTIVSGCVNTSGQLKMRVEKVLEESMVTRILDSVENAAASKPEIDKFITKFARVYTPFVVFFALFLHFRDFSLGFKF